MIDRLKQCRILIVDDTLRNIQVLGTVLKNEGYQINVAQNGMQALKMVEAVLPDLILLDIMMPELDGFGACQKLKESERTRDIPVIFLTAKTETEDIVKGFTLGAVDYVTKPFNSTELLARVHSHLTIRCLQKELEAKNQLLQRELEISRQLFKEACDRLDGMLMGESAAARTLREAINSAAQGDGHVLLVGPTGSGDEAAARAIHRASSRRDQAFIYVNCVQYGSAAPASVTPIAPAANDAAGDRGRCLLDLAIGGTVYLDRIHELPEAVQRDLLRALTSEPETDEATHPGGRVRIVAFTSRILSEQVAAGKFNAGLHRLISERIVNLPSLIERREDIPSLAEFFVAQYARRIGKSVGKISDASLQRLSDYSWPGNIGELQTVLEQAVIITTDATIEIEHEFLGQGLKVDRYRLIDMLGAGGMGEVWKAKHRFLARPVALKLIRLHQVTDPQKRAVAIKRFEREAQTTATLESPHTIKLYDYGVTEAGAFYFVMELLAGLNFDVMVTRFGPMPPERTIALLRQACRSLMEAHEIGFVHRDIKAENLFVCKLGREYDFVKVLDFGIVARAEEDESRLQLTGVDEIPGTALTVAPEVISGTAKADARTDLYSLGCVAYWMLTGKQVFQATNVMAMLMHHVSTAPTPPSKACSQKIPKELDQIILDCLAKKPDDRPASAAELLRRLEAVKVAEPWCRKRAEEWWRQYLPKYVAQ